MNEISIEYQEWLRKREHKDPSESIVGAALNDSLFDHQRDLVIWALSKGKAALFADTGLGKTLMQMEWARVVSEQKGRVLVLAPLAVAQQTVREADRFGIASAYRREDRGDAITVTNYEMLDRFDPGDFAGIVLDESSILKSYNGRTRNAIISSFQRTPFRLACTATPAPNDHVELGNHSEFLGVKSRVEMLAEYFVHDGGSTQNWRLKGHARAVFWRWVSSWAALVRKPSDLGYSDDGFVLPELIEDKIDIEVDHATMATDELFVAEVRSLSDMRTTRRETMAQRVEAIAKHIADEPNEQAIVWCDLNAESAALTKAIADAVEVKGSDSPDQKSDAMLGFSDGSIRVLVTKTSICGFGMNWQGCARMYFMGPSHSFEQTYQAVRRCWRFGQKRPVIVRTCVAPNEYTIVANLERKKSDAKMMGERMASYVGAETYHATSGALREWNEYDASANMEVPSWL